jgi:hypothetical protein
MSEVPVEIRAVSGELPPDFLAFFDNGERFRQRDRLKLTTYAH